MEATEARHAPLSKQYLKKQRCPVSSEATRVNGSDMPELAADDVQDQMRNSAQASLQSSNSLAKVTHDLSGR